MKIHFKTEDLRVFYCEYLAQQINDKLNKADVETQYKVSALARCLLNVLHDEKFTQKQVELFLGSMISKFVKEEEQVPWKRR